MPFQLIEDYLDGKADEALVGQLKGWLEADAANLEFFARQVFLHQQTREFLSAGELAQAATESDGSSAGSEAVSSEAMSSSSEAASSSPNPIVLSDLLGPESDGFPAAPSGDAPGAGGGCFWPRASSMFLMLLLVAVISGGVAFQFGRSTAIAKRAVEPQPTSPLTVPLMADSAPYVARLVKLTNCRWDPTRTTADLSSGSQLQPGQSLHLMEGIAKINSSFHSGVVESFQLEGPVGLMMASQGVPSLLYGKLSAKVNRNNDVFSLDTPLGRVSVAADASIGVSASANKVELHVFSGSAVFDPLPMFRGANADRRLNVFAGASVRVTSSSDGNIGVEHGDANEEAFITQASMIASELNISDSYVAAIKKAKPIAYCRFNRVQDGYVPNEMSDKFACRIEGPVRWRTYPADNRSIEFGFATQPGLLLTDDCVDTALTGGFTVELWAKPSYFQSGAIFSLARIAADNVEVPPQGMLLELLGPATDAGVVSRSRIRFLHRDPPGRDVRTGVSCFSDQPYVPRKWQHVAAVKDAGAMRLFVDGRLAAKAQDTASTAEDSRILMGQLYSFMTGPSAGVRPFVGELAEVAIYDKALSVDDINKHIKLAHDGSHPRASF